MDNQTSRERVLNACSHRKTERVPVDFGGTCMSKCTSGFLDAMREILGFSLPPDRDEDGSWVDEKIQKYLGVDLRFVPYSPPLSVLKEIDHQAYQEALLSKAREKRHSEDIKTTSVSHNFPLAEKSYEEIKTIKPKLSKPPRHMDWLIKTAKEYRSAGYATTYWVSGGFFESGCYARGYDQFAMDLLCEQDIVRTLFDVWMEEKLHQVETTVKPLAPYIDIFCFGDDFGLQTGPFMSPEIFQELIAPYYKIHYGAVHAAAPESLLFHHSCGSVYKLLDEIIEMGVDILNPIQPNSYGMDPEGLRSKVGKRLAFHGGIDLQKLLPFGTPDEVRAETARRMKVLGEDGGYICAPAHSLPEDVPVENILAMFGKSCETINK
ncbi:MAG: uroporphyrinogen decarboxylase family protein [Victivallales bacterium]